MNKEQTTNEWINKMDYSTKQTNKLIDQTINNLLRDIQIADNVYSTLNEIKLDNKEEYHYDLILESCASLLYEFKLSNKQNKNSLHAIETYIKVVDNVNFKEAISLVDKKIQLNFF